MSAQHTPGPWPITQAGDGKRWIIGSGLVEGPNGYEVAEVYADDCPYAVSYSNAHLIAAAPELLEALEALQREFFPSPHPDDYPEWTDARAALAKARGEA